MIDWLLAQDELDFRKLHSHAERSKMPIMEFCALAKAQEISLHTSFGPLDGLGSGVLDRPEVMNTGLVTPLKDGPLKIFKERLKFAFGLPVSFTFDPAVPMANREALISARKSAHHLATQATLDLARTITQFTIGTAIEPGLPNEKFDVMYKI